MHRQAGVNFEKFADVEFRDILLTGAVPARRMVGPTLTKI